MKIPVTPGQNGILLKDYQTNDYHFIGDVLYTNSNFIKMAPYMGEPGHYKPATHPLIGLWYLEPHYFD